MKQSPVTLLQRTAPAHDLGTFSTAALFDKIEATAQARVHLLDELVFRSARGDREAQSCLRKVHESRAVYAGTFDPFTLGHRDVVERAAKLFDEIIIAVGNNRKKNPIFRADERIKIIRKDIEGIGARIRIISYDDAAIDLAERVGARVLLRGVREMADFSAETGLALFNRQQTSGRVETLLLPARPDISFVSSSVAREAADLDKELSRYLSAATERVLRSKVATQHIEREWRSLTESVGIPREASERMLNEVLHAYAEKGRFHHALPHISAMLHHLEGTATRLLDAAAVRFALFFHDFIYDPSRTDNEERSAASAREWLEQFPGTAQKADRVSELILVTKHHTAPYSDFDAQSLISADLAVLASSPERYERYTNDIRAEYVEVPLQEYRQKRVQILRGFLAKIRELGDVPGFTLDRDQLARNLEGECARLSELQGV